MTFSLNNANLRLLNGSPLTGDIMVATYIIFIVYSEDMNVGAAECITRISEAQQYLNDTICLITHLT